MQSEKKKRSEQAASRGLNFVERGKPDRPDAPLAEPAFPDVPPPDETAPLQRRDRSTRRPFFASKRRATSFSRFCH